MAAVLIVPGLGGSGERHWQTHLERSRPDALRVHQADWDRPHFGHWTKMLGAAVEAMPGAILVAHSLGCALVAHLVRQRPELAIGGALLVAPADVDAMPCVKEQLREFAPMPREVLPFPSVVVASTNDPFMHIARAQELANDWNADCIDIGRCGHINVESGHGPWALAEEIVNNLLERRLDNRKLKQRVSGGRS